MPAAIATRSPVSAASGKPGTGASPSTPHRLGRGGWPMAEAPCGCDSVLQHKPTCPLAHPEIAGLPTEMPRWASLLAKGTGFLSDQAVVAMYRTDPDTLVG